MWRPCFLTCAGENRVLRLNLASWSRSEVSSLVRARGSCPSHGHPETELRTCAVGLVTSGRRPCKSFVKGKRSSPDARFRGARKTHMPEPAARTCASRRGSCLRRTGHPFTVSGLAGRHRRLSLCSLPVLKQFEGSLWSFTSVAQSATCRTWQSARCVILYFFLPEAAV